MKVTFTVDTNMGPERIKEALRWLVDRGELELEDRLEDSAEIDADSITVEA